MNLLVGKGRNGDEEKNTSDDIVYSVRFKVHAIVAINAVMTPGAPS